MRALPLALVFALPACAGGGDGSRTSGEDNGDSSTTDVNETIPVTTESMTSDPSTSGTGDPTSGTSSSGDTSSGSDSSSDGSGSGESSSSSESTGSSTIYEVDWCRLQFPADITVAVDEVFTVYGRLFIEGLTDRSSGNDPAPEVVADVGYGADGSDPAVANWTWAAATPNPGWDDATEPNNDEYMGDLSIPGAGVYDFAFRVSGDSGTTYAYCDLDDLLTGGYTPEQAGSVTVQ